MWAIFKDENDYNEKSIIGFASFAVMTLFAVVDLATGIVGRDVVINDMVYNSLVFITLGSFVIFINVIEKKSLEGKESGWIYRPKRNIFYTIWT